MTDREMSITDHLEELRHRLFLGILGILPVSIVAFIFSRQILDYLIAPVLPYQHHLVFLSPTDAIYTLVKLALLTGIVVTSPFLIYQVLAFVSPGLTETERGWLFRLLAPAAGLFLGGVAFGFYVFLPLILGFVLRYSGPELRPMLTINGYFSFVTAVTLPFGIVFEYPLLVGVLARVGVVSASFLRRSRRYAILVIFVIAAALAPPDALSMLVMASPMVALYEVGIVVAAWAERNRI